MDTSIADVVDAKRNQRVEAKPYPAYRQSGIDWLGDIPCGWKVQRAKNLLRPIDIRSQTGDEELLSVSEVDGVVPRSEKTITMFMAESYVGYKLCWPNDLVINSLWAWKNGLGVSRHHGIVSSAYGVYRRLIDESIDPRFLHLSMRSPLYDWELHVRSKGIWTSRLQLTDESFLSMPLLLPPLDEQRAIADFLAAMDERITHFIDARRRMIALLEEQKQAIINQAVTRGLDPDVPLKPSGIDWLGDIPAHWNLKPIGYFARIGNGSTPSRSRPEYWTDQGFPWLNSSVVNQGRVSSSDQFVTSRALSECHLPIVEPGDLLIGITGQGRTRGMAAVVDIRATINQHMAFIRVTDRRVNHEYLRVVLQAAYTSLRELSSDSGSTKGALTCEDIRHYRVPVPPEREQAAILGFCQERSDGATLSILRYLREIELIQAYRTRLISDVVTGKLDVRGLDLLSVPFASRAE